MQRRITLVVNGRCVNIRPFQDQMHNAMFNLRRMGQGDVEAGLPIVVRDRGICSWPFKQLSHQSQILFLDAIVKSSSNSQGLRPLKQLLDDFRVSQGICASINEQSRSIINTAVVESSMKWIHARAIIIAVARAKASGGHVEIDILLHQVVEHGPVPVLDGKMERRGEESQTPRDAVEPHDEIVVVSRAIHAKIRTI
ncbi:unnamed protein product [Clonostachys rosea f. rosea IK726]|uniref:Uncharacterized protein n=1 Tax=Clonostachys rosea f. rosea IK726 TaxID=1349383 RepID=A0ACA9TJR0_BIOOC|nr:unnamed protein product [Clonostachys rosea f. rosea IK726]